MKKQRLEESERRRKEERRLEKRKGQVLDADARKGRKVVAPEGRKVGLLKRRVQSHLAG